jgi:protein-tyrosine phosphatase
LLVRRPGRQNARTHATNTITTRGTAPTAAAIDAAVRFVLRERAAGHSVYIHCAHGHGRSATVAAAALIAGGQASSADAAVALMR